MTAALLPTGCEAGTYSSVRSLADRGVEPIVASEKDSIPAAASRFVDRIATLPDPREDHRLLRVIQHEADAADRERGPARGP